ncbi:MAG: hypothetical protein OXG96_00740 [Acidobacteria bacterium]|nr:hypothetical protein [Acidobacteriota bacterium]
MQDRLSAIRLSRFHSARSLLSWRSQRQRANQVSFEGDNYVSLIPLVTNENGARTNVGLNNFSRFSVRKKADPEASVLVQLRDPSGKLDREDAFRVRSNEMRQINRIMTSLRPVEGGGAATTGWLLIYSDEPITAWASVILDGVNNDPAVELAIADQIYKPAAYVESTGTPSNPLLIQSSVKAGSFKSRLAVVNIGSGPGRLRIKLFDRTGRPQQPLPAVDVDKDGMYVNNDIRSTVPGTWGQIIIEVEDLLPNEDDREPLIIATSLVESTTGPFAGFIPAFAMPRSNTPAIAGIWEGPVTGEIMNAQVRVTLYQERDMLYGLLEILSGTFPTVNREFLIRGAVTNGTYELEVRDFFDDCPRRDAPCVFFGYRMFAPSIRENVMSGDTIYFDGADKSDKGHFRLTRVGPIYPPPPAPPE